MTRIFNWIKNNKFIAILIVIVIFLLLKSNFQIFPQPQTLVAPAENFGSMQKTKAIGGAPELSSDVMMPPIQEVAPAPDAKNRLIIQNSYLSLLVKNVRDTQKQILETTENLGGYMVNTDLQNPQDAATGNVIVRIPSSKLQQALESFRGLAVKVVSENLQGEDVTDQYVDNDARLVTLVKTKTKFEDIMDKAVNVQDILTVQREIINLQSQIDAVKGQQNYLEKNAQMAKLTIYLSTDEFSLPYAPTESWRPEVIFKQATRSIIANFRKVGTLFIWIIVYSIIWLPIFIIIIFLKKKNSAINK